MLRKLHSNQNWPKVCLLLGGQGENLEAENRNKEEITCLGKDIAGGSPLKSVKKIWWEKWNLRININV